MARNIQTKAELEAFYSKADPWDYKSIPDDEDRKARMLGLIPRGRFARTLDIGCGNAFVTKDLPGDRVVGMDISTNAVRFAEQEVASRPDSDRFSFVQGSVFDVGKAFEPASFDLIIITGVIYAQYIGNAFRLIAGAIDSVLKEGGYVVSCHIDEWSKWRFPYTVVDQSYYAYRQFTHRLEVFLK